MTSTGTQHFGGSLSADYQLLRVATPADWHARLPGKRAGPYFVRVGNRAVRTDRRQPPRRAASPIRGNARA
eukprot:2892440-Pyramimonas_sp.AAC.1